MTLNKQGPGKIEWTDYTWNPVTGCKHGCDYCYARRIAERFKGGKAWPNGFEPTFHPERMGDISKKFPKPGTKIFVCSMADLFGDWVPYEWTEEVIGTTEKYDEFIFQFLTKNPARYGEFDFPQNCWLGTTVEGPEQVDRIATIQRQVDEYNVLFVSFEPLLGPILPATQKWRWYPEDIDWVIVGAQTGPKSKIPDRKWIEDILLLAKVNGCPAFLKSNLNWPEKIQEYPKVRE